MTRKNDVAYWIKERERIRMRKAAGAPRWLWTKDECLAKFRFCNVHREDDAVTIWLNKNWRKPFVGHPYFIRAMALARMINWPPTLKVIGFPEEWNPHQILKRIHHCMTQGKAWGSAYIVSTNGFAMDKAEYVVNNVLNPIPPDEKILENTLADTHRNLVRLNGLGSFMAAQVIADVKNTRDHPLREAPDWVTWAAPGPGSKRGLIKYYNDRAVGDFLADLTHMSEEVWPLVKDYTNPLCMQDWQNVMCEFDKWTRFKEGTGRPKARYQPNPEFD